MTLKRISISRKTGQETFCSKSGELDFRLIHFWQWATSDLLSNATRGRLAEYIVATDLGVSDTVRNEWDSFDLRDC